MSQEILTSRKSAGVPADCIAGDASDTTLRAFQGHRQADRVADIRLLYAE